MISALSPVHPSSVQPLTYFEKSINASLPCPNPETPSHLGKAWNNPDIRPIIERSILEGNFKKAPDSGRAFLNKLDHLSRQGLRDNRMYALLEPFFRKLMNRPEARNSFSDSSAKRIDRRVGQMKNVLRELKPDSLLDIGCGDGDITAAIQKLFQLPKEKAIGLEVFVRPDIKRSFQCMKFNGEQIPLPDNSQELATLFTVIHHADAPEKLLQETFRVLKPGGSLILRDFDAPTPNLKLFNRVMDEMLYRVYTPYPDIPISGNYFGREELSNLLRAIGFQVEKCLQASELDESRNPYQPFILRLKKPAQPRFRLIA